MSSNIAEGYGRGTAKDKIHFYLIAQGSLCEVESQLMIATDLGYTKKKTEVIEYITRVDKLLKGLMKSAQSRHT